MRLISQPDGIIAWPGGQCRLFAGVGIATAQRQAIAPVLAQLPPSLKPVPLENLHLTLRFLGQSSQQQATMFWSQLQSTVLPSFTVRLHELLCWPGPRVLCLAGDISDPSLQQLDLVLNQVAAAVGFPAPQHPLHPHLTLARNARTFHPLPVSEITVIATQLHLFQSVSTPAGVRYPVLASLPLRQTQSK